MGWFGLYSAILSRDPQAIAEELSPRANPNDPGSALELAVRQIPREKRVELHAWTDNWLRDSDNDCLRARGDARWRAVNRLDAQLRASLMPEWRLAHT